MFPPFSQESAHHYCQLLISQINSNQIAMEQVSRESEERKNQGVMVGVLVCWNPVEQKRILLACVSGNAKKLYYNLSINQNLIKNPFIFVPPIVSQKEINEALSEYDKEIHELTDRINRLADKENAGDAAQTERIILCKKRTSLTDISLKRVFNLYSFTDINKRKISLNQIINDNHGKLVPTGTGDCCAPKLLDYAFSNGLKPISMDEVFLGNDTKNKINGKSYEPCDERCGILLPYMLGLKIIYRDKSIVVIEKPSMLLSVPGRGEDKQDCAVNRLKTLIPECIEQPSVHRLDMETSGILIMALNEQAHKNLNEQFSKGLVHKKYIALLDGVLEKSEGKAAPKRGETSGRIVLKFRLDVDNRPHQIYDEINGKTGITEWEKLGIQLWQNPLTGKKKKVTRIEFTPCTGRTHQLRLASSHEYGLGLPIVGDTLYGKCEEGERLMLHAWKIEFKHPVSGKKMCFECPPEF